MAHQIKLWECENCKAVFDSQEETIDHELQCQTLTKKEIRQGIQSQMMEIFQDWDKLLADYNNCEICREQYLICKDIIKKRLKITRKQFDATFEQ